MLICFLYSNILAFAASLKKLLPFLEPFPAALWLRPQVTQIHDFDMPGDTGVVVKPNRSGSEAATGEATSHPPATRKRTTQRPNWGRWSTLLFIRLICTGFN